MILSTWSREVFWKRVLVSKLHTVLLPNLLCPNFKFISCVKFDILNKKLHARKCLKEKPFHQIHKVIYRPNLSRNILILTLPWRKPLSYRNQSIDLLTNQWTGFYMITSSVIKELSLQLISCQKTCKKDALTSNHELHRCRSFKF